MAHTRTQWPVSSSGLHQQKETQAWNIFSLVPRFTQVPQLNKCLRGSCHTQNQGASSDLSVSGRGRPLSSERHLQRTGFSRRDDSPTYRTASPCEGSGSGICRLVYTTQLQLSPHKHNESRSCRCHPFNPSSPNDEKGTKVKFPGIFHC